MLKIKGNREFFQWWEHWMSRLHPNHTLISDSKSTENPGGKGTATGTSRREEKKSRAPIDTRPDFTPAE